MKKTQERRAAGRKNFAFCQRFAGRGGGAIVFGLLALIAGVAAVVLEVNAQNICACVIPLVYFVCAIAARSGSR